MTLYSAAKSYNFRKIWYYYYYLLIHQQWLEINQFFFDMRGSFFLLKLGKTSSGGVGKDRLKKFLGKSDVGWSNTWWDRNVLLRARNALRCAPVDFVPVLKKNTLTLHAIEQWLWKNLFWTFTMKFLISFISYKTTDTYLFQLIILDISQLLTLRNSKSVANYAI